MLYSGKTYEFTTAGVGEFFKFHWTISFFQVIQLNFQGEFIGIILKSPDEIGFFIPVCGAYWLSIRILYCCIFFRSRITILLFSCLSRITPLVGFPNDKTTVHLQTVKCRVLGC